MGEREIGIAVGQIKKVLAAGTAEEQAKILERVTSELGLPLEAEKAGI
ncbi:MAG: hypothetical protein WC582_05255 [Patescibacteria group bacterium]